MRVLSRSFASCLSMSLVLLGGVAWAEIADLKLDQLEATATEIITGQLVRVYSSVEQEGDWEIMHSVAEIQVSKVGKGEYAGKLAYVRYWHRRFIGKGPAPLGANGQREIPKVGTVVRAYVRAADDGGFDVISPNGLTPVSAKTQ